MKFIYGDNSYSKQPRCFEIYEEDENGNEHWTNITLEIPKQELENNPEAKLRWLGFGYITAMEKFGYIYVGKDFREAFSNLKESKKAYEKAKTNFDSIKEKYGV